MDANIISIVAIAITLVGGVGGLIIGLFTKISKLEGRLDMLASDSRLREQVEKVQDESIQKLQQRATDLHETTQAQLSELMNGVTQQQARVNESLELLKTQEDSSVSVMTEQAQALQQQLQRIEQNIHQTVSSTETKFNELNHEIDQQLVRVNTKIEGFNQQEAVLLAKVNEELQQVKLEIEQKMLAFQQNSMSDRTNDILQQLQQNFHHFLLWNVFVDMNKGKTGSWYHEKEHIGIIGKYPLSGEIQEQLGKAFSELLGGIEVKRSPL